MSIFRRSSQGLPAGVGVLALLAAGVLCGVVMVSASGAKPSGGERAAAPSNGGARYWVSVDVDPVDHRITSEPDDLNPLITLLNTTKSTNDYEVVYQLGKQSYKICKGTLKVAERKVCGLAIPIAYSGGYLQVRAAHPVVVSGTQRDSSRYRGLVSGDASEVGVIYKLRHLVWEAACPPLKGSKCPDAAFGPGPIDFPAAG